MATTNLNITEVAASQNNKEVTINDALEALDQGTQGSKAQTITGNTSLSAADFTGYFAQVLGGTPAANFELNTPATKRLFLVVNNSGKTATVQVTGGGGASVAVDDGEVRLLYSDGADILEAGGGSGGSGTAFYDFGFAKADTPTASEVIGMVVIPRAVSFGADFDGAYGHCTTNPTAEFVISVERDGTEIGTITISTGGVFTFATTGHYPKDIGPGSVVTFVAPAGTDATIDGIAATLAGVASSTGSTTSSTSTSSTTTS